MNSWCSRCALFTSATVGAAMAARRAISPGWFMPSSTTAARWEAVRRNSVSGTPISLFRLPCVARRACSPTAAARIDAIISLTVVLPLLPVTPMTGRVNPVRQACAMRPSATSVSGTTIAGSVQPAGSVDTTTAATSRAATWSRKSWASNDSPRNATNSAPASTLRLSVDTPPKATSAPTRRAPGMAATSCASVPRINASSTW